ncbi:XRE family transcriptional regulator [Virgibacillus proomii]|uniref:XRE family transcriptional regulator n=1 Tax=Virgibacillus proomii TaxID=84407 RepID=UPI001C115D47|nr:XRE family transcriptional regulator [Virgibacillus proomii]MBU5268154.1 XRE family transcriptional regulator [Virgibacillus proomii]
MFPNLDAEMARRGVKRVDIANDFYNGRTATVSDKLNGKTPLQMMEAIRIRNKYFPDLELGYLFDTEPEKIAN